MHRCICGYQANTHTHIIKKGLCLKRDLTVFAAASCQADWRDRMEGGNCIPVERLGACEGVPHRVQPVEAGKHTLSHHQQRLRHCKSVCSKPCEQTHKKNVNWLVWKQHNPVTTDMFSQQRIPPPTSQPGGRFSAYLQMLPLSLKWSDGCSRTDGDVGSFQELLMARYDPK